MPERFYAPRICPVCHLAVNRNHQGNLSEHTQDLRLPRRQGAALRWKVERRRCPGSGAFSQVMPKPGDKRASTRSGLKKE